MLKTEQTGSSASDMFAWMLEKHLSRPMLSIVFAKRERHCIESQVHGFT